MNLRLVGTSYRLPRVTDVYYRLPRICDMTLLSQFQIIHIIDYVQPRDTVKFEQAVSIKDSAVVWSECLIARPPMEDAVDVEDSMSMFSRFVRTINEDLDAEDIAYVSFDKRLYDSASVTDRLSISFEKALYDYAAIRDATRGYIDFEQNINDSAMVGDMFLRFDYEKHLTELTEMKALLGIDSSKDTFADGSGVGDEAALGFDKKIVDDATLADSLSITLTRTTNSTYGQSVYGGATFGG